MALPMYCYDCAAPVTSGLPVCLTCANEPAIAPSTVLHGSREDYTITKVLGKGGMGLAYQATDANGDKVVVKQMFEDPDPTTHAENLKRFEREAQIQSSIINPRFPAGYGYFFQDGIHFMAMEFIPGQDLNKVLAASANGRLNEQEVLTIGMQVAQGIVAMHELTDSIGNPTPVLHRDIKPDNIVQRPNGEVVILDFGISRPENQSAATQARMTTMGTAEYMAKEQLLGSPVKQSDLYSIAATLYHLVTGQTLPQVYADRPAAVDNLPVQWRPTFRQALDDEPRMRQADVRTFHDDLRLLLPSSARSAFPKMVVSTATLGLTARRPQIQLNFGPLLKAWGWILAAILLAIAAVGFVLAKPSLWKSALAVLAIIGLVKISREISKHIPSGAIAKVWQDAKKWFSGLNLPVATWLSWLTPLLMVILLFIAINGNYTNLGWFAFLGGPFALSVLRYFAPNPAKANKKRRGFFSLLGMAVFGPALLGWALFYFVGPSKSATINTAPAAQQYQPPGPKPKPI